jgi:hypothetical protein
VPNDTAKEFRIFKIVFAADLPQRALFCPKDIGQKTWRASANSICP